MHNTISNNIDFLLFKQIWKKFHTICNSFKQTKESYGNKCFVKCNFKLAVNVTSTMKLDHTGEAIKKNFALRRVCSSAGT